MVVQRNDGYRETLFLSGGILALVLALCVLAVPMLVKDRVIGVMEVLDKIDESSFNMRDMELMGLFAQQAAMAIDQSQQIDLIQESMVRALKALAKTDRSQPSPELRAVLDQSLEKREELVSLLELAELFNKISALGEAERNAPIRIWS